MRNIILASASSSPAAVPQARVLRQKCRNIRGLVDASRLALALALTNFFLECLECGWKGLYGRSASSTKLIEL